MKRYAQHPRQESAIQIAGMYLLLIFLGIATCQVLSTPPLGGRAFEKNTGMAASEL